MPRKKGSKNLKIPTIDPTTSAQLYKATLKSVGRTFKAEGMTFEDALRGIKISGGAKAISVLAVEKGDKKTDKILDPMTTQRLFGQISPTTREMHLNKIKERFGL